MPQRRQPQNRSLSPRPGWEGNCSVVREPSESGRSPWKRKRKRLSVYVPLVMSASLLCAESAGQRPARPSPGNTSLSCCCGRARRQPLAGSPGNRKRRWGTFLPSLEEGGSLRSVRSCSPAHPTGAALSAGGGGWAGGYHRESGSPRRAQEPWKGQGSSPGFALRS